MNINSVSGPDTNIGATAPPQTQEGNRSIQDDTKGQTRSETVGPSGYTHNKTQETRDKDSNKIRETRDREPKIPPAARSAPQSVQDSLQSAKTNDKNQNEQAPKEKVEQAVSSVNDYIQKLRHRELEFSLDEKSGRMIIKVMDTDTKKVIRQIPPEEILRLAENIGKDKGWLVEEKA